MTQREVTFKDVQKDITLLREIKTSPLTSDYIVTPMQHLAVITLEELAQILALGEEFSQGARGETGKGRLHPLVSKWICPRCGSMLRLNGKAKWLRCEGVDARRLGWSTKPTCDAPPIDLAAAETLMFRALETFKEGREGSFSAQARAIYDQVVEDADANRKSLEDEISYRKSKLKALVNDLDTFRNNRGFMEALQAEADEHNDKLMAAIQEMQDLRFMPDDPDPELSLLELDNMVAELKKESPFGFEVNEEALSLRNRLREVVHSVRMVELGDDRYDVEFQIDVSAVFDKKGASVELVRFKDVPMKGGSYEARKRKAFIENDIGSGRHTLSDKEWKSRPALPLGSAMFGDDLRWVLDMLIVIAEWNGAVVAVKLGGERVKTYKVQNYRRSDECLAVVEWLQRIRPRSHDYRSALPAVSGFPTLRERLPPAHPLLDLVRFSPSQVPAPLSDVEWEAMLCAVPIRGQFKDAFRARVDQLIDMMRTGHSEGRLGKTGLGKWLDHNQKKGHFQALVNFFRRLEGKDDVPEMPLIPKFDRQASRS